MDHSKEYYNDAPEGEGKWSKHPELEKRGMYCVLWNNLSSGGMQIVAGGGGREQFSEHTRNPEEYKDVLYKFQKWLEYALKD